MKTILAVDGNSIINRAYFGVRPLTNGKGQRTEAIYGMLNMILSLVDRICPDSVQVAFDLHAPTFRHKMYGNYKGNRKGMEEELRCQMEPAKQALAALGYEILSLEGYEADDILGTIAKKAEEEGDLCCIMTGDRDSLQLISENTTVFLAGKGETVRYDAAKFEEKYGIRPDQLVDAKALMGDSSDCIPGVPGVGEKTALPLIAKFGSLDGLYAHLDDESIKAGLRKKLEENRESAYLSQKLAKICREVPVALNFRPAVHTKELYGILEELGFSQMLARLNVAEDPEVLMRTPPVVYTETDGETLLKIREKAAVSLENGSLYVSTGKNNYVCNEISPLFLLRFFTPGRDLIVFDSKRLLRELYDFGIRDFEAADDPMLAAYVLSSTEGDYSLQAICLRYMAEKRRDEPAAAAIYSLNSVLQEKLREEGCENLYRDIELPLAAVLARCEDTGFLVDKEGLSGFSDRLQEKAAECEKEIYALAGKVFNLNSPKQLGSVLFDDMGLVVPGMRKTRSGYSTDADTLEKLKDQPIVCRVLEYRRMTKLRSAYTEGLVKVADDSGRVHTKFMQTVTATGRLSSVEPNLQNIPIKTELGRELRRYFTAPEGRVLIDADYSQIELRLLSCIAGDETMIRAFRNGVDIHTVTASEVFGVGIEDVTPEMRSRAKAVNFGIVYGISAFSLADDLKVSRSEAGDYIKRYFNTYPAIGNYMTGVVESAKEKGYVTTLFGRKRKIPELSSGKGMLKRFGERVAMNSPIQGTAADLIKIAMVRTDRALREEKLDAKLILQVHDELIIEASEKDAPRAAGILKREMEGAASFEVPLTVELRSGKNWFDCK